MEKQEKSVSVTSNLSDSVQVVLASASSRRIQLLKQIGVDFQIYPADIDENPLKNETAKQTVIRLAQEKAQFVANIFPDKLIIAADTSGEIDNEFIAKTNNPEDALAMLKKLSGRTHLIHSAYCIKFKNEEYKGCQTAAVKFIDYDDNLFRKYVATGEYLDKAGSYAIQGRAAALIESIDGDFYSIMGLALFDVASILRKLNITLFRDLNNEH